jgi:hypothetical protein
MKYLLCVFLLGVTSCAFLRELDGSSLTHDERATVIARARTLALASGVVQESERAVVQSTNPSMSYYFLSGVHYAQYFISWRFADKKGVLVSGQGSMLTLEGAVVKRFPARPLRATAAAPGAVAEVAKSHFSSSRIVIMECLPTG